MENRIFIKPALHPDGTLMLVRKPVNGHLAAGGEWMPRESYWLRRLEDQDVVQTETPAPEIVPAAAELPKAEKPGKAR